MRALVGSSVQNGGVHGEVGGTDISSFVDGKVEEEEFTLFLILSGYSCS